MVFGLGIVWTGLTAAGALSGLVIGFLMGMAKFVVGNVYSSPSCGEVDDRPGFAKMHFMYYGENLIASSPTDPCNLEVPLTRTETFPPWICSQ